MANEENYIELIAQARLGGEKSMNRLAEVARERLRGYVHRLTLADEVTEDILQESMIEMFKFLSKLERADRFWPWLFRIATNNIHDHYGREQRRKTVRMSEAGHNGVQKGKREGLENLVSQEVKQVVSAAMLGLRPQYRTVLALRCYEEMAYSEISEVLGCSEFSARMRFLRAKKALVKQLARRGFGKGSLLMALILFGKISAPSEAAAAKVSVTAASVKVGAAAGLVGMAGSKAVIVPLATAGVVAVGTMVGTSGPEGSMAMPAEEPARSVQAAVQPGQVSEAGAEYWYYFPEGAGRAVMMQQIQQSWRQWLQDEQANYHNRKNAIYIENYRMWHRDLRVWRLPTDSYQLRDSICEVEGRPVEMKHVANKAGGLLVIAKHNEDNGNSFSWITRYYNVLEEDYFQCDWPEGMQIIDNRDVMHKRGWTYFRITGRINGKKVRGAGRMPFVYATSKRYSPWLRLQVGEDRIVDDGDGRLFKGLGRPWKGLHTIDAVRRDAAEKQIRFETELLPEGDKACVTLTHDKGKLVYTIDMEKDVIDKITFSGQAEGELGFSYLQEIDEAGSDFIQPRRRSYRAPQQKSEGMLWLVRLGRDKLNTND